jgi:hypothetical protein
MAEAARKIATYEDVLRAPADAWLVDPSLRTLDVLRLERGRWSILAVHADAARVRAEPFEAVELDLSLLWADVAPAT